MQLERDITLWNDGTQSLCFFSSSATTLVSKSIEHTASGWNQGGLKGAALILAARVESVVAIVFVALSSFTVSISSVPSLLVVGVVVPFINIPAYIPGISSYKPIKNFIDSSNQVFHRLCQVNWIGLRVILLFQAEAVISFIPGCLSQNNYFHKKIEELVKPLGPTKLITAKIVNEEHKCSTGTREILSPLSTSEEYLKFFSKETKTTEVLAHYITTRTYISN